MPLTVFIVSSEFIPPTLEDDSRVEIPPGGTFQATLVVMSGTAYDTIITEIQTVSPAGLQKSDLYHEGDSNVFYVTITWTPTTAQENTAHLFCYTAIDSAGLSSPQVCIHLLAGYTAPASLPDTATPNMVSVNPSGTTWRITFDSNIERPSTTAYITFHEFDTDVVVYRIDTSSSSEIHFDGSVIVMTPDYVFEENIRFYINFDRGVVISVSELREANEPITGRLFWTFQTGSPVRPGKIITKCNVNGAWYPGTSWCM